jgi:hypothetical protein
MSNLSENEGVNNGPLKVPLEKEKVKEEEVKEGPKSMTYYVNMYGGTRGQEHFIINGDHYIMY